MQERKPEASRKDRKWPTSSAGAFLILAAVFLLLHIPFLNQAFIIDDGNFIDQALQIVKNPLGPYSFNIHLKQVQDFFEYFANPPGFAYYLAAMIKVFGHSEVAMHSVCLIFSAMALLSMYVLSHEMTGNGLYGALLLLVTPTFLLSSHTVMPDIAAMAFYVLAILLFMRGMDRDDPRLFIAAGIAAGTSALLKYSGLTSLPLLIFFWVLYPARRRLPALTFMVAGFIFGAWCIASYMIYGKVHFYTMLVYESAPYPMLLKGIQGVAGLIGVGGATVFPLILALWSILSSFALSSVSGWLTLIAATVGFAAALPTYASLPFLVYDPVNRMIGAFLLSAGCSALMFVLSCGIHSLIDYLGAMRSKDICRRISSARSLLLVCWFVGIQILNIRLLFTTPKYLVLGLPSLILLLLGVSTDTRRVFASFQTWQKVGTLILAAALSVSLSVVDRAYGNSHKRFIYETLPARYGSHDIWFNGHWTIRYYRRRWGITT